MKDYIKRKATCKIYNKISVNEEILYVNSRNDRYNKNKFFGYNTSLKYVYFLAKDEESYKYYFCEKINYIEKFHSLFYKFDNIDFSCRTIENLWDYYVEVKNFREEIGKLNKNDNDYIIGFKYGLYLSTYYFREQIYQKHVEQRKYKL